MIKPEETHPENKLDDSYSSSSSDDSDDSSSGSSSFDDTDSTDSSYDSNEEVNVENKEIEVLIGSGVDAGNPKSLNTELKPLKKTITKPESEEERGDVEVLENNDVQQVEDRTDMKEGLLGSDEVQAKEVTDDAKDFDAGKQSEEKPTSSNEESMEFKISDDEKVIIQLSNEDKNQHDTLDSGIELEVKEPSEETTQVVRSDKKFDDEDVDGVANEAKLEVVDDTDVDKIIEAEIEEELQAEVDEKMAVSEAEPTTGSKSKNLAKLETELENKLKKMTISLPEANDMTEFKKEDKDGINEQINNDVVQNGRKDGIEDVTSSNSIPSPTHNHHGYHINVANTNATSKKEEEYEEKKIFIETDVVDNHLDEMQHHEVATPDSGFAHHGYSPINASTKFTPDTPSQDEKKFNFNEETHQDKVENIDDNSNEIYKKSVENDASVENHEEEQVEVPVIHNDTKMKASENVSSSKKAVNAEPLAEDKQDDPLIRYMNEEIMLPMTEKDRKDEGLCLWAEAKSERDDIVFEDFLGLRSRVVKPRTAWWTENEDQPVKPEEGIENIVDETNKALHYFLMKQLQESEAVDTSMDIDILNEKLQEERLRKKEIVPTKVWWQVDEKSQSKNCPPTVESRKWFFDSIHDQENQQSRANITKSVSQKRLLGKQGWLTEKDRSDEKKIAGFMDQDVEKVSKEGNEGNDSKNNDEKTQDSTATTDEKKKVPENKVSDEQEDDSEDEDEKRDETSKPKPDSIDMVIEDLQKQLSRRLVDNNIVHEDNEEEKLTFVSPLEFTTITQKARTAKDILKRNSKKSTKLEKKLEEPSSQIKDLIQGATADSVARRTNACGTLKLLASKKTNISMLINSDGLLQALIFVIVQEATEEEKVANDSAKLRALATLSMLSQPKDGRRIICQQDGLTKCLVNVLTKEKGEICLHACNVITALAKTEENREIIIARKGLLKKLSSILRNAEEKGDESVDNDDKTDEDTKSNSVSEDFSITSLEQQINAIRMNACAALLHLSKCCGATVSLLV